MHIIPIYIKTIYLHTHRFRDILRKHRFVSKFSVSIQISYRSPEIFSKSRFVLYSILSKILQIISFRNALEKPHTAYLDFFSFRPNWDFPTGLCSLVALPLPMTILNVSWFCSGSNHKKIIIMNTHAFTTVAVWTPKYNL